MKPVHEIRRVLFICTANLCRSVLGEYLLRHYLAEGKRLGYEVRSAGVAASPGVCAPDGVIESLRRFGVDATVHRSQPVTRELVLWADLILTMESRHQMDLALRFPSSVGKTHMIRGFTRIEGPGDVHDPAGGYDEILSTTTPEIEDAVKKLILKLTSNQDK